MPNSLPNRLNRISKAKKELLSGWKEGCSLEAQTGRTIDELHRDTIRDRLRLARRHQREALRALSQASPSNRTAISRAYYALYHAFRAAACLHHSGDDHQEHRDLPSHLPTDFPKRDYWQNALKDARERRNEADYDPYPKSAARWKKVANELVGVMDEGVRDVIAYLGSHGVGS